MSRRDVEAGSAFVRLFLKNDMSRALTRSLMKMRRTLANTGRNLTDIGTRMAVVGVAAAAPFAVAVRAASAMQETMSKFDTVFGDQAVAVKKWSDDYANAVGRSKQQIADFMAGTQDLFVPLGFDAASAEQFSKTLVELTHDVASFNNKADSDVLRDFHAALTGGGETVKKYGVVLDAAGVKARLLAKGIDPQKASNQQKVQARLNILLEGTTAAQGDAIRTAGSFANQMKRLHGVTMDTAVAVGGALLPPLVKMIRRVTPLIKDFSQWAAANGKVILTTAGVVAGVVAGGAALWLLGSATTAVAAAVGLLITALSVAGAVITFIASPIGVLAAALIAGTVAWFRFTESGQAAIAGLMTPLSNLLAIAKQSFGGIVAAITSGDFARAGKIAMATLTLVVAEGMDMLRSLFGEGVAGIAGRLAQGDIAGAWSDSLTHMGLLWASWSEGIVNTFTGVAQSVIDLWAKATTFISDKILELASLPVFAEAFELVSGVNVRDELSRGKKLGGPDLADVKGMAGSDIARRAGGMTAALDAINQAARAKTDDAALASVNATAGSLDSVSAATAKARQELDALTAVATVSADGAGTLAETPTAGGGGVTGGPGPAVTGGGIGTAVGTTFSAASALAQGFGPQTSQTARELHVIAEATRGSKQTLEEMTGKIDVVVRGLTRS